jgi:hypothetical protein
MGVFRIMYYWCQTLRAAEKQRGPACLATAPCCGLLPGVTVNNVVLNTIIITDVCPHTPTYLFGFPMAAEESLNFNILP